MNTLILAVLLLSGYIYVINSTSSRYKFKRAEGWGAYFYVAMWGAVFTIAAWLLCSYLNIVGFFRWAFSWTISHDIFDKEMVERLFPLGPSATFRFVDLKFALFGVTSIFISLFWAKFVIPAYGWCRWRSDRELQFLARAIAGDPHETLLIVASVTKRPVLVTLGSRKFYVGIVICPRFDHGKAEFLSLIPLLSGYRDKDTLTTTVTNNYQIHYEESGILGDNPTGNLTLDDFKTLISYSEIETISNFDSPTYSKFKLREEQDKDESKSLDQNLRPTEPKAKPDNQQPTL